VKTTQPKASPSLAKCTPQVFLFQRRATAIPPFSKGGQGGFPSGETKQPKANPSLEKGDSGGFPCSSVGMYTRCTIFMESSHFPFFSAAGDDYFVVSSGNHKKILSIL
jgi:hypothetical protein